jgi:peptidoglycan/xylan/chitin deacetylase (PgdA/CDA1 family)/SAM-dependent methyltransferase
MTPGRIAAIVTCHNLGRTLREALASIERQTRLAAEIVVVDDASTQVYTRQLLAALARGGTLVADSGGRGASAARNHGVRLTTSEYVLWLDADDILEPTWFEAAGGRLDKDPDLDFVSCSLRAFEGATYEWTPCSPTVVDAVTTGGVPHASTMVRRRLWEAIGGFDEDIPSFELLDFWVSAFERGAKGIILEESFLKYRVRQKSGYRRSIQHETYRSRLAHLYAKHSETVERNGLELLRGKEAFLQSQREYGRLLESRAGTLASDLARLQQDIADTTASLEPHGESRVDWGDLKHAQPLSRSWGRDRGTPIDRHYIEGFLDAHRADVRGRVLEVRDSSYTKRFGGAAVTASDVVDIDVTNAAANIIADLRHADAIQAETYDCVILTQTLQLVDDTESVLRECRRILRPGGVLLATVPGAIKVDDEGGPDGDFWRFTEASARRLLAAVFPADVFDVTPYGNVKTSAAFLYGISAEEVASADLNHMDPAFPLVITIRAVKPGTFDTPTVSRLARTPNDVVPRFHGAILSYHRIADLTPDSHGLCTHPDDFRAQMALIRRTCSPIALDDLVEAAATGRIPERAVAVTLDDGYLDALTTASPILMELGIPATFFVNSDRCDEEHERWWDVLERILLTQSTLPPVLTIERGGGPLRIATSTQRERADALEQLNQVVWPLDAHGRTKLVNEVAAWSGASIVPRSSHRVLTGEEIRTLACRPNHTIGAHTTHHLALTTQSADTKRREVLENKEALESLLQRPIRLFAYPYGEFDAELAAAVNSAGFRAAVTVEAGLVTAGINRLLLPRHEITAADCGDAFERRMADIFPKRYRPGLRPADNGANAL